MDYVEHRLNQIAKKPRKSRAQINKERLYRFFQRNPDMPRVCKNGHKYRLDNCLLVAGRIDCLVCKEEGL